MAHDDSIVQAIAEKSRALAGTRADFEPLLELTADATAVVIGEGTHGTHEFCQLRAELTERLIVEQGFAAVATVADFGDAYRVHRYVMGRGRAADAEAALPDARAFPAWMWRNADVLEFVKWLRTFNDGRPPERKVGFLGLDLYGLHASIDAVLHHLSGTDGSAAERARAHYACFEHVHDSASNIGSGGLELAAEHERGLVAELVRLQALRAEQWARDGLAAEETWSLARYTALVARRAEEYYRSLLGGRAHARNRRQKHLADTLDALLATLESGTAPAKVVVWAHNAQAGDARATELGSVGQWSLGQLARMRYGKRAVLMGQSTFSGTVTIASEWGAPPHRELAGPALPGSYEELLHRTGLGSFLLRSRDLVAGSVDQLFEKRFLQRAIGVVYRPETERRSHYFYADSHRQFDAVLHSDETRAVEPLCAAL